MILNFCADAKTTLPAGTSAGVFLPWLHRNPEYFTSPDTFDPDNFLPERVEQREQYSFLPFSAGPRKCIGFKFGINELKILTAWILRNFNIETSDTPGSVPLTLEVILATERPFNFILTKRL